MTDPERVAVVGGGIAGASAAYYLRTRTDAAVTVYERNRDLIGETTATSGGFLAFAADDDPVDVTMTEYAIEQYNEFFADAEIPYRYVGRLHVATTDEHARRLRRLVSPTGTDSSSSATATRGTPIQYVDGDDLARRLPLPTIDPDAVSGALLRPVFGHVDPVRLTREFVDRARSAGATFRTNSDVDRPLVSDGRATGVVVDGEEIDADAVVCAAGPWNPRLLRTAGVDLPIRHSVAPALVLETESPVDRWTPSVKHEESGYYFRQNADGTLFVGHNPGDYAEAGRDLDPDEIESPPATMDDEVADVLADVAPGLGETAVVDSDVGVRCLTPDGRPVAGRTSVEGLHVVAFNASGIHHAPVAGDVVARQLGGGDPAEYDDAVSPARFE